MKFKNIINLQKGGAIVLLTILVLGAAIIITTGVALITAEQIKATVRSDESVRAYYLADMAMEKIFFEMYQNKADPTTLSSIGDCPNFSTDALLGMSDNDRFCKIVTAGASPAIADQCILSEVANNDCKIQVIGKYKNTARSVESSWQ